MLNGREDTALVSALCSPLRDSGRATPAGSSNTARHFLWHRTVVVRDRTDHGTNSRPTPAAISSSLLLIRGAREEAEKGAQAFCAPFELPPPRTPRHSNPFLTGNLFGEMCAQRGFDCGARRRASTSTPCPQSSSASRFTAGAPAMLL